MILTECWCCNQGNTISSTPLDGYWDKHTGPVWGRHEHMRNQTKAGSVLLPRKQEPVIFPPHTSPPFIHEVQPSSSSLVLLSLMFHLCRCQSQLVSEVWRAEKHQLTCLLMSSRFTVTFLSSGFLSDNGNAARVIGGMKELLPVGLLMNRHFLEQPENEKTPQEA